MFKRNGKILRWRKKGQVAEKWSDNQVVEKRYMFEINGDIIIRQKYGDVSDILRDDQMKKKMEIVLEKWSHNKICRFSKI
jgi:hypothetical protein